MLPLFQFGWLGTKEEEENGEGGTGHVSGTPHLSEEVAWPRLWKKEREKGEMGWDLGLGFCWVHLASFFSSFLYAST